MRAEVTELFLSFGSWAKGREGLPESWREGHLGRILGPLVKGHSWLEGDAIEREPGNKYSDFICPSFL